MRRVNSKINRAIEDYSNSGIYLPIMDDTKQTIREKSAKCLWNALITFLFLISFSGLFIDAFELPCNNFALFIIEAITSVFFSFLYINRFTFNFGYVFMLLFTIFIIATMYMIVNSGFSAILNLMIVKVDDVMNLPALREFTEFYSDRNISITSCLAVINILIACILNMWVARRKSPLFLILTSAIFVIMSSYLEDDVNFIYIIILAVAFCIYLYTRSNDGIAAVYKNFKPFSLHKKTLNLEDRSIEKRGNLIFALTFALVSLFITLILVSFAGDYYFTKASSLKSKTDNIVYNVAWHGISALWNDDIGSGGVNNGSFGNVNSISYDGNTDLEVSFVPYSSEPVYLRSYVADYYNNQDNKWESSFYQYANSGGLYKILAIDAEDEDGKSANATMIIKNVDAGASLSIYPYYVSDATISLSTIVQGSSRSFSYIANLNSLLSLKKVIKNNYMFTDFVSEDYLKNEYLQIPDEIEAELKEICEEEGFSGGTRSVIEQIQDYFSSNYEYTLSPGATPSNKDFVLYFLEEQKKGFCVHFASAACLLLREMGIPARYCEGYCFDTSVYEDAVLFSYSDDYKMYEGTIDSWYEGYSEINYTEPVSVDLTDANAHAWVEVYYADAGWVPFEFTVGSYSEDESSLSFLNSLSAVSSVGESTGNALNAVSNFSNSSLVQGVKSIFTSAFTHFVQGVLLIIICLLVYKRLLISYRLYYCKAEKRVIYQYRRLVSTAVKILRKSKETNYDLEVVISHDVLYNILVCNFGFTDNEAAELMDSYKDFNYSEASNENISDITGRFKKALKKIRRRGQ